MKSSIEEVELAFHELVSNSINGTTKIVSNLSYKLALELVHNINNLTAEYYRFTGNTLNTTLKELSIFAKNYKYNLCTLAHTILNKVDTFVLLVYLEEKDYLDKNIKTSIENIIKDTVKDDFNNYMYDCIYQNELKKEDELSRRKNTK